MKKILILNGAGKKNGNTAELIKAFTDGAESAGNTVTEFYLQTMSMIISREDPTNCFIRWKQKNGLRN